jgi:membrane protein DedA with SNARE-associated domain
MKTETRLPAAFVMLSAPLAAYADGAPPTGHILSFVGGFAGSFLGALVACWLCKRFGSKNDTDSKRK